MKVVKLWILAAMSLMAFGAIGTAVASAEDGPPQVLCFKAKCIQELKANFSGGASALQELGGLEISSKTVKATLENCKELTGSEGKDGNLCEPDTITFEGAESKGAKCNSEGAEKGVIKVEVDLHLAAEEETKAKVLEPLQLFKIINPPLKVTCGVVKEQFKGVAACLLLPGLTSIPTTKEAEIVCKLNTTTHDAETGKCEVLCEWLEKEPLEAKIGEKFEMAALNVTAKGKFTSEVFLDD